MTMFKCFFKIVNAYKVSIIVGLVLYAVLLSLGAGSEEYGGTVINVAVIDRDGSELSAALNVFLTNRYNLVEVEDDTEALQDALFYRDADYILFIPQNFERDFLNGNSNPLEKSVPPESVASVYFDNQLNHYFSTLKAYLNAGSDLGAALENAEKDISSETVSLKLIENDNKSDAGGSFRIASYILIVLLSSTISFVLMAMGKNKLKQRMNCSSLSSKSRNIQIVLACSICSMGIWLFVAAVSIIACGKDATADVIPWRTANLLAYLPVCVSIAFLMGQVLKTSNAVIGVMNILSLGMSFLCGAFVTQDLLGEKILSVSKFLPAYWYIRNHDALSDYGLNDLWKKPFFEGILIQLGFAAAVFMVTLVVTRQRKQSSLS